MISSHFVRYEKSQLHYIKAGSGKDNLLFFHGFGQDHSVYLPIIQSLSDRFTLYIFDLYFHGRSIWGYEEAPLEKGQWKAILDEFLSANGVEKFSVTGFSLGGKFALASVEAFPDRCEHLFLIAPDGIKTNFWYSLATYPFALRKLFRSFISNHQRFVWLIKKLQNANLVDKGLLRFADYQMNTEEKRKRVYYSWIVFRHLKFNQNKLSSLINKSKIATTIIVGRYDKVILPDDIASFAMAIPHARFEIVEAGHSGLLTRELLRKYLVN